MKRRTVVRSVAVAAGLSLGLFPFSRSEPDSPEFSVRTVPEDSAPLLKPRPAERSARAIGNVASAPKIVEPELTEAQEVIQDQIIPRLGQVGLSLIETEDGINEGDELMVGINDECGSQFSIAPSSASPDLLNVSATIFGKLPILRRFKLLDGFPEFDNRLAHQEGALINGMDFAPANPASLDNAVNYMAETTKQVCANQGLLDRL